MMVRLRLLQQFAGENAGGGAGIEHEAVAVFDHFGGAPGDGALGLGIFAQAPLEGRLADLWGRATVPWQFEDLPVGGERPHIAPDRFLRNVELARQVRQPQRCRVRAPRGAISAWRADSCPCWIMWFCPNLRAIRTQFGQHNQEFAVKPTKSQQFRRGPIDRPGDCAGD